MPKEILKAADRATERITAKITPTLRNRIDDFIEAQSVRPGLSEVIRVALERMLDEEDF